MFGAIAAFLAVTLLVKFAELLLTQEHRLYIPESGFVVRHLAQVWLSLRFSWQDFAVAGALFPPLLQWGVDSLGWRSTMQIFAIFIFASVSVLALLFLKPAPVAAPAKGASAKVNVTTSETTLGLPPNALMVLLMLAVFCCCVPMAMPMNHVVAYCGDLGFASQTGAVMLSVLPL